jgi:hypothetical protein
MPERLQQKNMKRKIGTFQTSIAFRSDVNHLEYSYAAGKSGR